GRLIRHDRRIALLVHEQSPAVQPPYPHVLRGRAALVHLGDHHVRPIGKIQLPYSLCPDVPIAGGVCFQCQTDRPHSPLAYLITSSARRSSDGGIVIPSSFAVLRLMTSSNFVGCSTGKSAGLAPFRILSTYVAPRRRPSGGLAA